MDVWELLPWDIQCHILSGLSVKDLLKLELVSKGWQSIIDSPTFRNLQFYTNLHQNGIIMDLFSKQNGFIIKALESTQYHNCDLTPLTNKFNNPHSSHIYVLGVTNGFVHHENVLKLCFDNPWRQYAVCNPAAKQLIELPQISCEPTLSEANKLLLICNPTPILNYFFFIIQSKTFLYLTYTTRLQINGKPLILFPIFNYISNLKFSILIYYYLRKNFMLHSRQGTMDWWWLYISQWMIHGINWT